MWYVFLGYAWRRDLTEFTPRQDVSRMCLRVMELGEFAVNASTKFGSFEAKIEVPEDANPTQYSIELYKNCRRLGKSGGKFRGEYIAYLEDFTVGDPRPRTAILEINAPAWVSDNSIYELIDSVMEVT